MRSGFLIVVLLMLVGPAYAGHEASGSDRALSTVLQVAQNWDDMSPGERGEAYRNYQRYRRLPPEQRRTVEENYDRWRELPPDEKERLRGTYQQYRRMSPPEKKAFKRHYREWKGER